MTDRQRDLGDARAAIEELTRERDSAKEAELWVRDQLRLIAESDAVRIEELTRERDEALATIGRVKPVVDVAMVWFDSLAKSNLSTPLARNALIEVIAAYVETDP